ncbi:MAG: dependent epimerase/dehydratase family protein [Caulobacteraceae bacterium]|nr:dependent epimerase/dehydratase family protein [Caulobacteraceae bacterium]
MSERGTVLVSGGSGFIGSWCVIALLERGYTVRTTVRDLRREAEVRSMVANQVDPGNRLSVHAANLASDEGWDAAAEGAEYVLHVASPLGVPPPKNPDDLITPAHDGAMRVVRAAIKAGAARVVMTSSVAATSLGSRGLDSDGDETVWTHPDDPKADAYTRSKTIAERAAWDVIAAEGGATSLAVVNPALVLGPVLGRDFSDSVQIIQRLLSGKVPGLPRLGFNIVDVRDVADLHMRAMTDPAAAGQRFIASGEYAWMADLAAILRERLGPQAAKVPTAKAPDILLRVVALFDRDLRAVTDGLGRKRTFSSAKAKAVLGWEPRPMDDTVLDCARSLIAAGLV